MPDRSYLFVTFLCLSKVSLLSSPYRIVAQARHDQCCYFHVRQDQMQDDQNIRLSVVSGVLWCIPGSLEILLRRPAYLSRCPFETAELYYPLISSPDADKGHCMYGRDYNDSLLLSGIISDHNQNNESKKKLNPIDLMMELISTPGNPQISTRNHPLYG
jgi:hypothetical protein